MSVTRYQEGTIERRHRATGPDVWVYRWRERVGGKKKRRIRSHIIGTVEQYPSIDDAKRANDNFRIQINAQEEHAGKLTVRDAWGHFQENELRIPPSIAHRLRSWPTATTSKTISFPNGLTPIWKESRQWPWSAG